MKHVFILFFLFLIQGDIFAQSISKIPVKGNVIFLTKNPNIKNNTYLSEKGTENRSLVDDSGNFVIYIDSISASTILVVEALSKSEKTKSLEVKLYKQPNFLQIIFQGDKYVLAKDDNKIKKNYLNMQQWVVDNNIKNVNGIVDVKSHSFDNYINLYDMNYIKKIVSRDNKVHKVSYLINKDVVVPAVYYTFGLDLAQVAKLPKLQNLDKSASKNFFRTSASFKNTLDVTLPSFFDGATKIVLVQNQFNSPIPTLNTKKFGSSLSFLDMTVDRVKLDLSVSYDHTDDKLQQQGSNMASLMQAVYNIPILGKVDVQNYSNKLKKQNLKSFAKGNFKNEHITWDNSLNFDKQWYDFDNNANNPILPKIVSRDEQTTSLLGKSEFNYKHWRYSQITWQAFYDFRYLKDKLTQRNSEIGSFSFQKDDLHRSSHNLKYGIYSKQDILSFNVYNSHYFSNTASHFTNLFPEVSLTADLSKIFDIYRNTIIWKGSAKRTIGEVALIDKNAAVLSTIYKAQDFNRFYEYQLPIFNKNLRPEIYQNYETSLEWSKHLNYGNLFASLIGFYNHTNDLTYPTMQNDVAILENVGRLRNYGFIATANFDKTLSYKWFFNVFYSFQISKTKVSALYNTSDYINLGGFENISTVLSKGEPLGVIYGYDYQRNELGDILTNSQGQKLMNTYKTKIGNPNPDFIMKLSPTISYKNISFGMLFEYSQGAERWNGTQYMIDLQQGNNNIAPVDYIENANYLRLSDVNFTYHFRKQSSAKYKFKVGASASNLFTITSYKGVDSTSRLFGYTNASGLDLFNLPSIRTYSFFATFNF